jgi:Mg/Co/Ni transporter MgtE
MVREKRALSIEELESQTVLELPERETPVLVVIGCIGVCVGRIRITVEDVNVAAQICAAIDVLNVTLGAFGTAFTCTVRQN